MRMDQLFFAKSLSYWGQAVAKSLSGPPPDLLAGRVFSCHMALLLRRSDIEVSGWLCLSCTNLELFIPTYIQPLGRLSLLSRGASHATCEAMPFSTLPVSTAVSVDIMSSRL